MTNTTHYYSQKELHMKIVRLSIQVVTLILISCTLLFAGQQEQSWEYKNWQVKTHEDFISCITHGQVVHGHEFGILKKRGNGNQNLLYISWSASGKGFVEYQGKDAELRFNIDGLIRRQATIPLLSAIEPYPGRTIGVFTNLAVGENFISLLKSGHKLEVTIHGPDELVNTLDITSDTFSLDGFTATLLKAQEFCELTGQGESSAIHAQQTQKVNEASRITVTDIDPKEDKNVHSTLATEQSSQLNTMSNHKVRISREGDFSGSDAIAIFFILGCIILFGITIFLFVKFVEKGYQNAEEQSRQKEQRRRSEERAREIEQKEKALVKILVTTLSAQKSLFGGHAGLLPQRAKDNWSMGYIYGYSDAFLKHNGYIGTFTNLKSLQVLIATLDTIFDEQGQEYLQRIAELQKAKDKQYTEGLSNGRKEMIDRLQDNKNIPLGWAIYVDETPSEDMERPKVIHLQANTEPTQNVNEDNSHEKSFSYPKTKSNEASTLKSFFENTGSFLFIALFVGGYFPVNMILAFIFGDKMDVVISLFIPFYGYIVMLF